MRCGLMILVVSGLTGMGLSAQTQARQPVRFVGRVHDARRRPVDHVEVIINRREVRTTTDSLGVFHLDVAPGDSTVGFRRIGYRSLLVSLNPLPPESDTILVELVSSPVELEEVIVTGAPSKPLRYAGTMKYDDVFARRKIGLGTLISREVIDRRPGARTYQLLEGVAGVFVYDAPIKRIRLARCREPGGVTIWIDGHRQPMSSAGHLRESGGLVPSPSLGPTVGTGEEPEVEVLSRVNPSDIEMIEVFLGPSEIPGVFHENGCAAIAIWTKWNK